MQKYTLHKNFIEESVLNILSNWIDKNKHTFQDAGMVVIELHLDILKK